MAKPVLLLFISDPALEKQILDSPKVRQYEINNVSDSNKWIDYLSENSIDLVIAQVDQFDQEDLQKLTSLGSHLLSNTEIIFISSGEPNSYIDQAMKRGVAFHLRFPVNVNYIDEIAAEIFEELTEDSADSESIVESSLDQFGLLVGSSSKMKKLYRIIRKSASSDASILIMGESGSGKELVANTLHMMSERSDGPYISVNCGAISHELIESELFGHVKGAFTGATSDRAGVFEQADGGTLFLDEVTEMPLTHQVKLLRVLETSEYRKVGSENIQTADIRIIAATNREPANAIEGELFREDLYFRLAQFPIRVPSLRERENDIVGLTKHFLAHRNAEENSAKEISSAALEKIKAHDWPGNVRELKHTIERAFILADDVISVENLIVETISGKEQNLDVPSDMPLDEIEKNVILQTLESNAGNKTETAEQLGISVKTLYNKLEKYDKSD